MWPEENKVDEISSEEGKMRLHESCESSNSEEQETE